MKLSAEQQSVLAIGAGLFAVAWIKHSIVFLTGGVLVCGTLPFPLLNRPLHKAWIYLSKALGWISSHIILTVLFYLFLTPISWLRKLTGRQDMKIVSRAETSCFYQRDHLYQPKDFENPW